MPKKSIKSPRNTNMANIIRWTEFNDSEEYYMHYYNLDTKPQCIYCEDDCKYISFSKGFSTYCDYNKHKHNIIQNGLIKRGETIKSMNHNIQHYDEFIFKNMNFYIDNIFPKIDIFDGKKIRNITTLINKSQSNLKFFDVHLNCVCCNSPMIYNFFTHNKVYCNKKSCTNTIRYNGEYIDIALLYDFTIYDHIKFKKSNKLQYDLSTINKLYIQYGFKLTKAIISGYSIIYDNAILNRSYLKYDFSLLKNNVILPQMQRVCKCCGEKYIFNDILVDNNHNLNEKIIGAEHSCQNKECYHHILTLKLYDRDGTKQSITIRNKILDGTFTPCITNSWANSKIFLKIYNMNFRSTWEAYFYIFCKCNNINVLYEKLRIKYFDTSQGKIRTYITDFLDDTQKILYEIKPKCYIDTQIVKDKEKAAKEWCNENNYLYVFITEDWFKINYNVDIIEQSDIDIEYKNKMLKSLKFKG